MGDRLKKIEEKIKAIKMQIVGRDDIIDEVSGLLGRSPYEEPPASLYLYGDSATGKSLVLNKCLSISDFVYATAKCVEAYSIKLIYESIINQLANHSITAENNYQPYARCNNLLEFVLALQNLAAERKFGHQEERSIIIVFDKCEKLRNLDKSIIPALIKLRELTKLKLCSVFVSALSWSNFYTTDYITEPITVFFGQYDHKILQQILLKRKPEHISASFYDNFLKLFLSVYFSACHDVRELEYQASLTFEHYYDPIKRGELTENDSGQLWMRSQAYFKRALRSLYLKIDSSMELTEVENITSATTQAMIMELPFYSKYILIAAYIASYNPASEDRRLFVKSNRRKKSTKVKSERTKHHLLGPKPFTLQRLFAIVPAILDDDKFSPNADLFVEVGSLLKMKLLIQASEDILDGPSFKCNVGLQFIDIISRNVQFPIRKYLVDFMDS